MLLKVIGHEFGGAEILHGIGHLDAEFFAKFEICVDRCPGGEDYCSVIGQIDFLFTEFPGTERLDQEERPELNFCSEFVLEGFVCSHLRRCLL